MFTKTMIALSALGAVALPSAAQAGHRGYDQGNYGGYDQGYYGGGYDQGYYGGGYNQGYDGYDQRYEGRRTATRYYDGRRYRQRCGNGTTGAIVGGAAGALIGREVARGGRDYYGYRRRGNGTVGAIVGGALGAIVGKQVARGRC